MYNINYNRNFRNGYKAAMDNLTMPLTEMKVMLTNDKEWNEFRNEYLQLKEELLKYLPDDKKDLLVKLEVSKRNQSNRSLMLMYESVRDKKPMLQ